MSILLSKIWKFVLYSHAKFDDELFTTFRVMLKKIKIWDILMTDFRAVWPRRVMFRNYRSDSCPLEIALRRFVSGANICFKNIKFPRGKYQPIVPHQRHSIV